MSDTFLPASRPRRQTGFAGSMAFSAARGAALIGLAVIIGIVLLQVVDTGKNGSGGKGGGAVTSSSSSASSTATTAKGATTTVKGATTTKATGTPKTPAQLNVVVLNGSPTNGAAAAMSSELAKKGYQMATPGNTAKRTGTVASCTAGLDREAAALAAAVGSTAKVAPFPSPAPTGAERANCIVIVGS